MDRIEMKKIRRDQCNSKIFDCVNFERSTSVVYPEPRGSHFDLAHSPGSGSVLGMRIWIQKQENYQHY
jgi:hypothetical protein